MILRLNSTGPTVKILQGALLAASFDPMGDDGVFGPDTENAVKRFQAAHSLTVDGAVNWPTGETANALHLMTGDAVPPNSDATARITLGMVVRMFPDTPVANVARNLPFVLHALSRGRLGDREMVLMALATIRAETESFEPIAEGVSHWNTSGDSHDFDLYDGRHDIGNGPAPDGATFRGRGYVQLTGRTNYTFYGPLIGIPLVKNPDLACDPTIAAELLAQFLRAREAKIRSALADNDLATARRLVNGGTHGLTAFVDAYRRGVMAIPA